MTNELVVSQEGSNEDFIADLNNATGFSSNLPLLPAIKFNAESGSFMQSTGEKDEEGFPIYEDIGDKIELHILTTRKMVQSDYNSSEKLYSREFLDDYVEIYNERKEVVMKGLYKVLKDTNKNLQFIQVLYVMVGDKPYRLKLSGSKLINLYPYLKQFVNDSPARFITIAEKGMRVKKQGNDIVKATEADIKKYEDDLNNRRKPSLVLFYQLNFTKGDEIVDKALIAQRVNDINYYISTMNRNRSAEYVQPEEALPTYEEANREIEVDLIQ